MRGSDGGGGGGSLNGILGADGEIREKIYFPDCRGLNGCYENRTKGLL